MAEFVDGPESLFYPGRPKWGTAFSGNTITYNFMPSLPEIYFGGEVLEAVAVDAASVNVDSFKPFDIRQEVVAEEALNLWSEVANIKFERQDDVLLRLADIVDFGILDDVLKFLGLYDDFAKALDKTIGKLIGFPVVQGADIRFGTDDQDGSSGRAFPPRNDLWARFNELKTDIADFIDKYLSPVIKPIEIYNKYNLFLPDIPIPSGASVVKLAKIKFDVYGDVFLNNTSEQNFPQKLGIKGAKGFHTLLHEVGHALGLKHTGNYNASGGGAPEPYLPREKDSYQYAIMSYDYAVDPNGNVIKDINGNPVKRSRLGYPRTPMLYDIAAIQELYGSNLNTRSDDTTYSYSETEDSDGDGNPNPFMETIWDGGGIDTIDAINHSRNIEINLNAGEFSSVGFLNEVTNATDPQDKYNLAIAFNVVIENAIGGTGNDTLTGNNVNNLLSGRDGNDSLIGAGGADTLNGGNGIDTASYSNSGTGISINLAIGTGNGGDAQGDIFESIEILEGSEFDDNLIGDASSNTFNGNEGNDSLNGNAGNDLLIGEAGNDLIDGGDNIDTISYSKSPNGIAVNIDETSSYQNENSIPVSPEPNFTIASGTAEDGFEGTDTLKNLENIIASQQDDILIGNSSDNKIEALEGNDLLIGNTGSDTLDGGNGNDTVSYRRETNKVNVNLETEIATEFSGDTDTLISIENVIGSAGDDEIIGDQNSNIIFGEEGKDSLQGKQGDDKLIGGKDGDVIDGGEGNDTASYFTATDGVTANLTNSQENTGDAQGDSFQSIENLEGSEFGDRLFADVQNNDIQGLGGDDYLDGLTGDDTMSGGTGNDTYKIENVNDVVIENIDQGIDTVDAAIDYILGANLENLNLLEGTAALNGTGNELNNIINGNSGDNVIFGGDGDDSITGGLGNESSVSGSLGKINGTPGSDILTGGNGNDAFIYNNIADTGDLITDFTVGNDKIVVTELLQSLGYAGSDPITDGFLGFKQASDSLAVLQIDPDGAASDMFNPMPFILLDNVSVAALNDSINFVF